MKNSILGKHFKYKTEILSWTWKNAVKNALPCWVKAEKNIRMMYLLKGLFPVDQFIWK